MAPPVEFSTPSPSPSHRPRRTPPSSGRGPSPETYPPRGRHSRTCRSRRSSSRRPCPCRERSASRGEGQRLPPRVGRPPRPPSPSGSRAARAARPTVNDRREGGRPVVRRRTDPSSTGVRARHGSTFTDCGAGLLSVLWLPGGGRRARLLTRLRPARRRRTRPRGLGSRLEPSVPPPSESGSAARTSSGQPSARAPPAPGPAPPARAGPGPPARWVRDGATRRSGLPRPAPPRPCVGIGIGGVGGPVPDDRDGRGVRAGRHRAPAGGAAAPGAQDPQLPLGTLGREPFCRVFAQQALDDGRERTGPVRRRQLLVDDRPQGAQRGVLTEGRGAPRPPRRAARPATRGRTRDRACGPAPVPERGTRANR